MLKSRRRLSGYHIAHHFFSIGLASQIHACPVFLRPRSDKPSQPCAVHTTAVFCDRVEQLSPAPGTLSAVAPRGEQRGISARIIAGRDPRTPRIWLGRPCRNHAIRTRHHALPRSQRSIAPSPFPYPDRPIASRRLHPIRNGCGPLLHYAVRRCCCIIRIPALPERERERENNRQGIHWSLASWTRNGQVLAPTCLSRKTITRPRDVSSRSACAFKHSFRLVQSASARLYTLLASSCILL